MTITEKRKVGKWLRSIYSVTSQIRFAPDGAVTCKVNPMPNTNQEGWIFAGWDTELLRDMEYQSEYERQKTYRKPPEEQSDQPY